MTFPLADKKVSVLNSELTEEQHLVHVQYTCHDSQIVPKKETSSDGSMPRREKLSPTNPLLGVTILLQKTFLQFSMVTMPHYEDA